MMTRVTNALIVRSSLAVLICILILTKGVQGSTKTTVYMRQKDSSLVIGKPLPDITLQTANGTVVKLSALKGKVLLVDFWASWCMPCRAAIPHLKTLYQKYHDKGFEILSISIDQKDKAWKTAMLKEAMPWQQAIDAYEDGKEASVLMGTLGIQSVPFAIMLDKDGKVMQINPEAGQIDSLLARLYP